MAHSFTPVQLGDSAFGKKSHLSRPSLNNRLECLERVRLMSPKLPFADECMWPNVKLAYCTCCRVHWARSTGSKFQHRINLVVDELGKYYGGCARVRAARTPEDKAYLKKYQTKPVDNKEAFYEFYQEMQSWLPKSLTSCAT